MGSGRGLGYLWAPPYLGAAVPPHCPAGTPERGASTPGKGPGTVEALSEEASGGNVTVGGSRGGAGVLLEAQEVPPPGEPATH